MFEERPKKELNFLLGKALAFARPELFMARLMPHDQLDLIFQAACSAGTSKFVVTADPHMVEKLKRTSRRPSGERDEEHAQDAGPQVLRGAARRDVRGYMDATELTANRVGTLLAGTSTWCARW